MNDANGSELNIGDVVWFIPKPTHREDILLKGTITKITPKTITVEALWYWSKYHKEPYMMEFRRNPSNVVLVAPNDYACLRCKSIKG